MYASVSKGIEWLARLSALAGGIVLLAVTVMTCVSIIGRMFISWGLGSVPGDFEMVEVGLGFAVFAFLPWCQFKRGHATVDLFQPQMGKWGNRISELVSDVLMLLAATVITWRLYYGMLDKKSYTETTFILQFPVWIAYAAALVGAVIFVIVSAFCVIRAARNLTGGHGYE